MTVQERRTQPSILLTFKVLQFAKQLRRRLKPRLQASEDLCVSGMKTCLGLESKALRSLTKGLSRLGPQQRKQSIRASDRVCKSRNKNKTRPTLKLQTTGQDGPAIQNISGGEVQHMLDSVDSKLKQPGSALSAMASDDRLFLKQNAALNFEACSLNETIQSLIAVHEGLNVLSACRSQHDDGWIMLQGREAGLNFDEAFLANYEHLLLRLQTQLIDALERKVLDSLLLGDHDKRQRKLLAWFTEFSDKPRPLSTFPWTIKPSLAVLWGVCWMFYYPENRQDPRPNAQGGNLRVPQAMILQNAPQWNAPGSTDYLDFGVELLSGTQPQPAAQQPFPGNIGSGGFGGGDLRMQRLRNADTWVPTPTDLELGSMRPSQGVSRASATGGNGLGSGLSSTYCPQFPAGGPAVTVNSDLNPLPTNSGNANLTVFPQQLDPSSFNNSTWHPLSQSSLPQRTARHLTNSIPSVRVTGSADIAAPHPEIAFGNISQGLTQDPQAPALNVLTEFPDFINLSYNMGNCPPPETSPIQIIQGPRHERTSSVNSNSNIPTPVSMSGPRSPLLSPVGDRRLSVSSQGPMRHPSEDRSSQDGDDVGSPGRRNHAYKRSEDPPRNNEGKMVCKHKECEDQTFDRKCEWSKHMDKHDRPYKCNVKGCEKLQGFTYSGGLLRHEREVHKMHGGTKKSLYCPFTDCKRSSGSGFTRKENLAEHIRRVHRRTSMSADLGHLIVPRDPHDETGVASIAEVRLASESPYQRTGSVGADEDLQFSLKRKRLSEAGIPEEGEETDLRSEVKRLRRENEEKDARLRQLEAAVMALQQGRR